MRIQPIRNNQGSDFAVRRFWISFAQRATSKFHIDTLGDPHHTPLNQTLGSANQGAFQMSAELNTSCTDAWDCNNRNVQDWKKEGSWYYIVYNGANYYLCGARKSGTGDNLWGLALTRSSSALEVYPNATQPTIPADVDNTCGIAYGTFATIGGAEYIYYVYNDKNGGNTYRRSQLVWGAPVPTQASFPAFTLTPTAGSNTPNSQNSKTVGRLTLLMQLQGNLVLYQDFGTSSVQDSSGNKIPAVNAP